MNDLYFSEMPEVYAYLRLVATLISHDEFIGYAQSFMLPLLDVDRLPRVGYV